MRLPLSVQNTELAKECPFYCQGSDGQSSCLLKTVIRKKTWEEHVFQHISEEFNSEYEQDCLGQFNNCCFANEIWTGPEQNSENILNNEEEILEVKVAIHKVENPYKVKCDILIYPTNNLLEIDDMLLNRLTRNQLQPECDSFNANVNMGDVYITSNGNGGVAAKQIYHAVVAGESRLVNDNDVQQAIKKALIMADANGAEIVTLMPADCGTHDLDATALAQLTAIHAFLEMDGIEHIKYIFVIMDDQDTYDVFIEKFSRIFA